MGNEDVVVDLEVHSGARHAAKSVGELRIHPDKGSQFSDIPGGIQSLVYVKSG